MHKLCTQMYQRVLHETFFLPESKKYARKKSSENEHMKSGPTYVCISDTHVTHSKAVQRGPRPTHRSHDGADDNGDYPAEVHGQPGEQRDDERQQEELFRRGHPPTKGEQQQNQTKRQQASNREGAGDNREISACLQARVGERGGAIRSPSRNNYK